MSKQLNSSEIYPLGSADLQKSIKDVYRGRHYKELPTPALVVKEDVIDANIISLFQSIDTINSKLDRPVKYRAHIKTHKTIEGTLKQLGYNLAGYDASKYESIVVSTLREAYLVLDYQEQTNTKVVTDMLYGLPACVPDIIPQLYEISKKVDHFRVFVDNLQHIEFLEDFAKSVNDPDFKWSVFVKIDCGTHRAGVFSEEDLVVLLERLLKAKDSVELHGFYAHAGHSYSKSSSEAVDSVLMEETSSVNNACKTLLKIDHEYPVSELILSVGASPTARSFQNSSDASKLVEFLNSLHGTFELHAGNLIMSDLQQVATGSITEQNIGSFVLGTVISQYPKRGNPIGEMLTNTGVLAMTKEVSQKFPGYGLLADTLKYGAWYLQRLSQEHGILQPLEDDCKMIPHGTKIEILMQHVCITMACFGHFFVVNKEGIITDVWIPCRGW
ncbi:unnamed protein product [Kluyveromyces dobzhanskii CBS 2104]|uniref:D-serine dehydratase n=1 Tax=Kluyveromyces dobzhanskii CBS 2104 TaxID=1427455 RepID=A0A0A8LC60_9SACH|nr:unnamed protein product [Kluyveromyces dobzhanskii CBS 2104]